MSDNQMLAGEITDRLGSNTLARERAQLVVLDVQEGFREAIDDFEGLARRIVFLCRALQLLRIPILASEQYPKGLGTTAREIEHTLVDAPRLEKRAFDATQEPGFLEALAPGRDQVLVVGLEAHICVLQTTLGLLRTGRHVFLAIDAIGSQRASDATWAVTRLVAAGAVPLTTETAAFELCGTSAIAEFRELLQLVKARLAIESFSEAPAGTGSQG
jgi:nicotinamidase-related amidase